MLDQERERWESLIGRQIRLLRLRQNLHQTEVAERAGIALNAVKNLERGTGATLASLIGVLGVLNRLEWLGTLGPPVTISPIQMLTSKKPRQRASRKSKAPTRQSEAEPRQE